MPARKNSATTPYADGEVAPRANRLSAMIGRIHHRSLSPRVWMRAMMAISRSIMSPTQMAGGGRAVIHFHALTTDRLALFSSNGRDYTRPRSLPSAACFGEPCCLLLDLEAGPHRPAAGSGPAQAARRCRRRGFVTSRSDAGRDPQASNGTLRPAQVAVVRAF